MILFWSNILMYGMNSFFQRVPQLFGNLFYPCTALSLDVWQMKIFHACQKIKILSQYYNIMIYSIICQISERVVRFCGRILTHFKQCDFTSSNNPLYITATRGIWHKLYLSKRSISKDSSILRFTCICV